MEYFRFYGFNPINYIWNIFWTTLKHLKKECPF